MYSSLLKIYPHSFQSSDTRSCLVSNRTHFIWHHHKNIYETTHMEASRRERKNKVMVSIPQLKRILTKFSEIWHFLKHWLILHLRGSSSCSTALAYLHGSRASPLGCQWCYWNFLWNSWEHEKLEALFHLLLTQTQTGQPLPDSASHTRVLEAWQFHARLPKNEQTHN